MKAYVFPGQGSQFSGMGKDLYEQYPLAKELFEKANDILGFRITDIMFSGTEEDLKQTRVTQPAIFLHSVIKGFTMGENFQPQMVAGHSLGEFSALVANKTLTFEDGLRLVSQRAMAMQKACEIKPSTMAAVLGLEDAKVEEICASITDDVVVAANYNCPGQLVISGTVTGIEKACELLKAAGAKRALVLNVGGAFHSPLMEPARVELEAAINSTTFSTRCAPLFKMPQLLPFPIPKPLKPT
jgi:[acyl-carrier-protein] S-malonyltransferase